MNNACRPRFTGKAARILRVVYAALSAASALGIAAVLVRLLIRNPREAAVICAGIAILAVIRMDLASMARDGRAEDGRE